MEIQIKEVTKVTNGGINITIEKYIHAILLLELFSGFEEEELLTIFGLSSYRIAKYAKGAIIHLQNEICETMEIILEGSLSVQKIDEQGNILKVAVFSGGDILGANLLFSSSNTYPMTIVAESKIVILHIDKDLILNLSTQNTKFIVNLLTVISDKTLVLTSKIDTISFKTIRQRINDFLMYEHYIQKTKVIKLSTSKKELAQRLGIQRSSLSRELNKMRQDGLIEYDSKTITLKDISVEGINNC